MPKKFTPIKIRSKDELEYKKLVRNTKRKIRDTKKKYNIDLSDAVELPKLESFETRDQYNEWKQSVQSFTNRNNLNFQFKMNPYGIVTSKADLMKIESDNRKAIRIANQKLKEQEKRQQKQLSEGKTPIGMIAPNTNFVQEVKQFNFNKVRSMERLNTLREANEKKADPKNYDEKAERMRRNFVSILEQSLNSDADALIERILAMPVDDFVELFDKEWEAFDFTMWSSEQLIFDTHNEAMQKVSEMMSHLDVYERGGVNMDLKGF